jgi:hypothetical protein
MAAFLPPFRAPQWPVHTGIPPKNRMLASF